MENNSIYRDKLLMQLPRLLSLYDLNPYSQTRGFGDRLHWGWKLIDFNNGTFQGGIHTLSIMVKLGLFTDEQKEKVKEWIHWIIEGIGKIRYGNGSLIESFPYEYSFCVTALVAFDLLSTIEHLEKEWNKSEHHWALSVAEPLIGFISHYDETHGFISNHLATAAAAVNKWNLLSGDKNLRGEEILSRIIEEQSAEGWYLEYEGPDPGYQTLCTYYLADYYLHNPDSALLGSLRESIKFLSYFVHPDGTIGGEYGSRNTEVYYPAGFEILKRKIPLAGPVARIMRRSIEENRTVSLEVIDPGNFIPMLNSYAVAALFAGKRTKREETLLPYEREQIDKFFPQAQIRIHGNTKYYTIVGASKGGVVKVYDKQQHCIVWDGGGYIGIVKKFGEVSTQFWSTTREVLNSQESIKVGAPFFKVLREYPTPLRFTLLRILNITVMRNLTFGNRIKLLLVKMLITRKKPISASLTRTVLFQDDVVEIIDELVSNSVKFQWLEYGRKFTTIHMASSGYFQSQRFVKIKEPSPIDMEKLNCTGTLKNINQVRIKKT
ncbi:hypothetical protein ES702_01342 [subsurface metagenome]